MDKNGALNSAELSNVLGKLRFIVEPAEIEKRISGGEVPEEEFLRWYQGATAANWRTSVIFFVMFLMCRARFECPPPRSNTTHACLIKANMLGARNSRTYQSFN